MFVSTAEKLLILACWFKVFLLDDLLVSAVMSLDSTLSTCMGGVARLKTIGTISSFKLLKFAFFLNLVDEV